MTFSVEAPLRVLAKGGDFRVGIARLAVVNRTVRTIVCAIASKAIMFASLPVKLEKIVGKVTIALPHRRVKSFVCHRARFWDVIPANGVMK